MASRARIKGSWGIDPVPERLRVLGMLDTGLLFGNLGVSLLVIAAGAVLVPALSPPDALVAILLGCVIGNAMLGIAGAIGSDARVPQHYDPDDMFAAPPWRPGLVGAWIAGFALYQWLFPTGPGAWVDLVETLDPPGWGIGATVPSFLASFAVAAVVALVSRRWGAPTPAT